MKVSLILVHLKLKVMDSNSIERYLPTHEFMKKYGCPNSYIEKFNCKILSYGQNLDLYYCVLIVKYQMLLTKLNQRKLVSHRAY